MFRLLFERSADAMTLLDLTTSAFLDVNEASVRMTGAPSKAALLGSNPAGISPEFQPDGATFGGQGPGVDSTGGGAGQPPLRMDNQPV